MNTEICKECRYYKCYFHDYNNFSKICLWTLKNPETIEKCSAHNGDVINKYTLQSFYTETIESIK